jgi:hypothetical protein
MTDLAPGENVLWRNIKRRLFFGHITQIMEVTKNSIILWREHPPLTVRIPIASLTDVVVTNYRYMSSHYGFSPCHGYGYGFSGPRAYIGQSVGTSTGDIEMFSGSRLVMQWQGLVDPHGVANLIKAEMR